MNNLNGLDDEALVALAAPLIDELDELLGDSDFEADCDDVRPIWRIGAVIARQMKEAHQ